MTLLAHQSVSFLHLPVILSYQGLTEEPSGKSDSGTVKQRKMSKKNTEEEPKARVLTSTNSDRWGFTSCGFGAGRFPPLIPGLPVCHRLASESADSDLDVQLHCSSSLEAEPEAAVLQPESPPLASAFAVPASFEEDVLDLKWRQSLRALLCPPTHVLSPFFSKVFFWGCFAFNLLIELQFCLFLYRYRYQYLESRHPSDNVCAAGNVSVCVFVFTSYPSATVHWVFVLPHSK